MVFWQNSRGSSKSACIPVSVLKPVGAIAPSNSAVEGRISAGTAHETNSVPLKCISWMLLKNLWTLSRPSNTKTEKIPVERRRRPSIWSVPTSEGVCQQICEQFAGFMRRIPVSRFFNAFFPRLFIHPRVLFLVRSISKLCEWYHQGWILSSRLSSSTGFRSQNPVTNLHHLHPPRLPNEAKSSCWNLYRSDTLYVCCDSLFTAKIKSCNTVHNLKTYQMAL